LPAVPLSPGPHRPGPGSPFGGAGRPFAPGADGAPHGEPGLSTAGNGPLRGAADGLSTTGNWPLFGAAGEPPTAGNGPLAGSPTEGNAPLFGGAAGADPLVSPLPTAGNEPLLGADAGEAGADGATGPSPPFAAATG